MKRRKDDGEATTADLPATDDGATKPRAKPKDIIEKARPFMVLGDIIE